MHQRQKAVVKILGCLIHCTMHLLLCTGVGFVRMNYGLLMMCDAQLSTLCYVDMCFACLSCTYSAVQQGVECARHTYMAVWKAELQLSQAACLSLLL